MNPVADINALALAFGSSEKTRIELRPISNHDCFNDPSKALFRGAAEGNISLLRAALCSGMNPNSFFKGQTPLMYAAEMNRPAACLLLITSGASVNLVDHYRRTALHYACRNKNVACAAALMDGGANIDIECDLGGETPADLAKLSGNRMLIRFVVFYEQNIEEIRDEILGEAKNQLQQHEGLGLHATQPVIKKGDLTAAILASSSSEDDLEDEL